VVFGGEMAMGRMLLALCFAVMVGIGFSLPAAAQMGCPPGQTFIPTFNRCIASANGPSCPPGTHYDADLRRCLGVPQNKCADNETFDPQQNACVPTPK
jgi:hypothetical protein